MPEPYESHRWVTKDGAGPSDAPDFVTYCADCGIEDLGDPAEFNLIYPVCGEEPQEKA